MNVMSFGHWKFYNNRHEEKEEIMLFLLLNTCVELRTMNNV
jgi:hypothetical protein